MTTSPDDDITIPDFGETLEPDPGADAPDDDNPRRRAMAGESGALRELYWWVHDRTNLGQFNIVRDRADENAPWRYGVSAVSGAPEFLDITDLLARTMAERDLPVPALETQFAEWLK